MTRNKVKENVHITLVGFVENLFQIFIRAVAWSCLEVIGNIIACVSEWGFKAGIYPDRIAAQLLDIIQLFDNAVKIADAVTVGIVEGLGIDLIEHCVIKPF